MKKNSILMLALCSLSFMSFAATPILVDTLPQKKTVVLEEYTGIGCGNCPYGHLAANQMAAKYPKSVLINIHQGGYAIGGLPDLTTPFGDALFNQTGGNGYPSGTLNRQVIAPSKVLAVKDYSQFPAYASKIVEQDAYLNVAASSSIDWLSRILTVNVEVYYTENSPANVNFLNVAVLQSKIMGSQAGMMGNPDQVVDGKYQHNHALRTLLTGQWGDSILTTSKGSVFTKTFTYTIPANIKKVDCILENIEVVAFVCQSKKEIINGAKSSMTYINQPSLYVNLIKGEQIVHNSCDSAVNGYVKLINKGSDSIVSVKFKLNAGLDTVEYEWTASAPLMYNQIDSIILLPTPTLPNMTRR
ncbi:MAG: Omp28-related outer membrane protein, partial [Bacteroidales bacterium]